MNVVARSVVVNVVARSVVIVRYTAILLESCKSKLVRACQLFVGYNCRQPPLRLPDLFLVVRHLAKVYFVVPVGVQELVNDGLVVSLTSLDRVRHILEYLVEDPLKQ